MDVPEEDSLFAVDEAKLAAMVRGDEPEPTKAPASNNSSSFGAEWIAGVVAGSEGSAIYTAVTKAWREDTAEGKSVAEKLLRSAPLAMPGMAPARIGDALGSATRGLMKGDTAQTTDRGVDAAVDAVGTYGGPVAGKIGGRLLSPLRPLVARLAIGAGTIFGPAAAQAERPIVNEVAAEVLEDTTEKVTATAVKEAGEETADTLARGGSRLPTLTIDASKYPQLDENIAHAQAAGHPQVLTYNGGGAASVSNRSAATSGIPKLKGTSIDEYPFASSVQGGSGAWVGHVPVAQQNAQGAILRNFYGSAGIRAGDSFIVKVINFW
jgi:hypothetical protein